MAIISLASLKGGVGKTSLSVNLAHAFRLKGYRVLLFDGDPAAHASRFFKDPRISMSLQDSALAKLFFSLRRYLKNEDNIDLLGAAEDFNLDLLIEVRENFFVLPGGPELHHFLWGPGARLYKQLFPMLIHELESVYDMIIIDTAPDFNLVTRNALAISDLVVVPVDSSEMSISSLEDLIFAAGHIKKPNWAIARTMVNTQAKRVRRLSGARLEQKFQESQGDGFLEDVRRLALRTDLPQNQKPLYLLNTVIKRTEQQNRLSFLAKTSFDTRETKVLAEAYKNVANELDLLLSIDDESREEVEEFYDVPDEGESLMRIS